MAPTFPSRNRQTSARAGLTIYIYIPPGIVKAPGAFTRFWWFVASNPILLPPFLTLAVMWGLWYSVGRDPDPGISVAPLYEPPQGMTPAEAGTLLMTPFTPATLPPPSSISPSAATSR